MSRSIISGNTGQLSHVKIYVCIKKLCLYIHTYTNIHYNNKIYIGYCLIFSNDRRLLWICWANIRHDYPDGGKKYLRLYVGNSSLWSTDTSTQYSYQSQWLKGKFQYNKFQALRISEHGVTVTGIMVEGEMATWLLALSTQLYLLPWLQKKWQLATWT